MLKLLLINLLAGYYFANVNASIVVETKEGILHGKEIINDNGKVYHSFTGIPYAEPPVGNFRFKPPQKLKSWEGVRVVTNSANICKQVNMYTNKIEGYEDCLYLNIYVPQTSDNSSLPVLFWIHGGGFISGSGNSDELGPDFLMDYDVIVVTINYRVGAFGFLNLELEDAPGNLGLLDQVEALRWVNKNIAAFGGDPEMITIAGNSAGAASVHYMILSDITKGLFQRAILQSGSALNPWALQRKHLKRAFDLCESLGHPTSDTLDALEFLQKTPADDILNAKIPPEVEGQLLFDFVFVPSVEKEFQTHKPFLTETPINKIKSNNFNKVPTMMGFNNAEGIFFFNYVNADPDLIQKFEDDFERFIPNDLEIPLRSEESVQLAEEMRKFYFNNKPISEDLQGFVNIAGDNWFTRGIYNQAKFTVQKQNENIYFYEYCFDEYTASKLAFGDLGVEGASHVDEMANLFRSNSINLTNQSDSVVQNQKRMLKLWTNFIKSGNPTPHTTELLPIEWEPMSKNDFNYYNIDSDISTGKNPEYKRMSFWEDVTKRYKL